ncbi:MAG TPA: site-2 protease family protein [Gemmataceae bacterium]|nr:site-2 protease family protein [Gemmataceae bacterium]
MFIEPNETAYDLRWRMFGTPVRVHPLFWLISLILGYDSAIRAGVGFVLAWVGCVFVSVLLHEFGHVWMGRLFGSHGHIVLYSFGGLAIGSNTLARRWQRILVTFAGPFVQLILLALLWLVKDAMAAVVPEGSRKSAALVWLMLFEINLLWPLLNLLPIWPLDGGQISREICQGLLRERGTAVSLGISLVVSGVLAVHELMASRGQPLLRLPFGLSGVLDISLFRGKFVVSFPLLSSGDMFMAVFFALFCISSFAALQAENERRRKWDNDEWT